MNLFQMGQLEIMIEGTFPVKIEFEDDSFELSEATFSGTGQFSLVSNNELVRKPFRISMVSQENELLEFLCESKKVDGTFVSGTLSTLDH